MTFHQSDDVDSESASIHDVLMCWESGEDDDDIFSIKMIPKIEDDFLDPTVNIIPASPRGASPTAMQGKCETLDHLLKKYPDFVPHDLPQVATMRARPLCIFINFMGTREPPKPVKKTKAKTKKVKAKAMKPSPYPTEAPSRSPRPSKKPKMTTITFPVVTPTSTSKKHVFHVSPIPTLGPTSTRYTILPTF